MKILYQFLALVILLFLLPTKIQSQKIEPNHKLLWRISSPELKNDSYVYGTMHVNNSKVFNFSDSVYLKIEACNYFALEVHPDTLIKHLIVDPFNQAVNQTLAEQMENFDEDELKELEEIKNEVGFDIAAITKENLDLIPLMYNKIFKKNKDKNTFLDAHLYHIARFLNKNVVGLESIEDHRKSLRFNLSQDSLKFKDYFKLATDARKKYEQLLDNYISGDVDLLYQQGGYQYDKILATRNEVMVNSSLDYIENGGIFMAVGAAHLSGKDGMLEKYRMKGYTVEPVTAIFSKNMPNAEWAENEIEWITQEHPEKGFSIALPDKPYQYRPESVGGIYTIHSYPDLGLGQFFYYYYVPIMVANFGLEDLEMQFRKRLSLKGVKLKKKNIKYSEYGGLPMLELNYVEYSRHFHFRFIINNNSLYTFGVSPMQKKVADEKLVKRFFDSVKFIEIENEENGNFTSEKGAFTVKSNYTPQTYSQTDETWGVRSTSEFANFMDHESRILHMVTYVYNEPGHQLDDTKLIFEDYESQFFTEKDSLIYSNEYPRFGGKEFLIEYNDGSFLNVLAFVRGNRLYQLMNLGKQSDDNYKKSVDFFEKFSLIGYSDFNIKTFENEKFVANFPSKPLIDSILIGYSPDPFNGKSVEYKSMDKFSSLSYIISELELSPYNSYSSMDSALSVFKNIYESYGDTMVNAVHNGDLENFEIEIRKRNKNSQLDFFYKFIFSGDKVYELELIQDTAFINDKAITQLVDQFELNGAIRKSIVFRDTSEIKQLILDNIFDQDSVSSIGASEALSKYTFKSSSKLELFNSFKTQSHDHGIDYMKNMLRYFNTHISKEDFRNYLQNIYQAEKTSNELKVYILQLLIENENKESISMVEKMLSSNPPMLDNSWQLNSLFYEINDSLDLLLPVVPAITSLRTRDSSFVGTFLIKDMLDQKIITFDDLTNWHQELKKKFLMSFEIWIDEDQNTERWSAINKLINLGGLLSYGDKDSSVLEVFHYLYQDSTIYYKLNGLEFLLRQNIVVDTENIYEKIEINSNILELYELQRQFDSVILLPDSMLSWNKYIEVASIAYPEEEEYFENYTLEVIEEEIIDNEKHYFLKCIYQYEEDDENYELIIHTVLPEVPSDIFQIPENERVYSTYEYAGESTYEETKKTLLSYYNK